MGFIYSAVYNGPSGEVSVTEYSGIEPYVRETGGEYSPIEKGNAFGEFQGLQFPPGILPNFTQADQRLRYVVKVRTPDGVFAGAALEFTLQREAEGYRPVDVQVSPLAEEELKMTEYDPSAPAPFPTRDPAVEYPLLGEARALLDGWQTPLLSEAGWLHLVVRQEEPGGNGLYGSLSEWITEDWSQIDERGYLVSFVTIQHAADGQVLQQVVSHAGKTTNLTFGGTYDFTPYRLDLDSSFYSGLFQQLKADRPVSKKEATLDGRPVWVWVLTYEEEGRIQRETFDQESGRHLTSELVNVDAEGKEELVWRYTYEVAERAQPPAEILGLLGQEFQGYVPPAPQGTPAPPGFDPSASKLTARTVPGDSFERPTRFFSDIYAGDYLLGRVDFGAHPDGNCERSADGSKLAYTYDITKDERLASSTLHWLDLRDITQAHAVAPELILLGRAFWSPVGEQIALSACTGLVDGLYQDCGVYLYDLPKDEVRLLTNAGATVWDLLWKPDETQIAFVSTMDDSHPYFVIDTTGAVLEKGSSTPMPGSSLPVRRSMIGV